MSFTVDKITGFHSVICKCTMNLQPFHNCSTGNTIHLFLKILSVICIIAFFLQRLVWLSDLKERLYLDVSLTF